jgi:hypothetical protein
VLDEGPEIERGEFNENNSKAGSEKFSTESPPSLKNVCFSCTNPVYFEALNHAGSIRNYLSEFRNVLFHSMTQPSLSQLLQKHKRGAIAASEVLDAFSKWVSEPLGFASVDHHRRLRQGFPEVILAQGKSPTQVARVSRSIVRSRNLLLVTRASRSHYTAVRKVISRARYNPLARTITANEHLIRRNKGGKVLVVTAGTSDLPVAEEAFETARMMGNDVELLADVGVAGIHRLLSQKNRLFEAAVVIVVAGMEGALPSVVGGLVSVPVIAVPTSTGYGASFEGISALLGMLNSCAAGVTVVNIDNGFGAGFAASRINRERTE